jgi:type II secretory pathway pseudopilin PulG
VKTFAHIKTVRDRQNSAGFTLTEVMVSATIFMAFFLAAMVAIQLYGLRVYTLAATKITATADSREVLNTIRDNIRECKVPYIGMYTPHSGSYSSSYFSRIATGSPQVGNALALYMADTNGNPLGTPIIYYQDPTTPTNTLMMVDTNGNGTTLLYYMTNYYCFDAEDYSNNILSTYNNTAVIHLCLQFVQWQYPIAMVTNLQSYDSYDYYTLESRVSRRPTR